MVKRRAVATATIFLEAGIANVRSVLLRIISVSARMDRRGSTKLWRLRSVSRWSI
jgi:hypothetical protein